MKSKLVALLLILLCSCSRQIGSKTLTIYELSVDEYLIDDKEYLPKEALEQIKLRRGLSEIRFISREKVALDNGFEDQLKELGATMGVKIIWQSPRGDISQAEAEELSR